MDSAIAVAYVRQMEGGSIPADAMLLLETFGFALDLETYVSVFHTFQGFRTYRQIERAGVSIWVSNGSSPQLFLSYTEEASATVLLSVPDLVKHPVVTRFIKGVLEHRLSLPRYCTTWDASLS